MSTAGTASAMSTDFIGGRSPTPDDVEAILEIPKTSDEDAPALPPRPEKYLELEKKPPLPPRAPTDHEVCDLGWNSPTDKPLVHGLQNEDVYLLLRRFNKQMHHVKSLPLQSAPKSGPDLETAHDEELSPDKLRGIVERLYMTIIVGLLTFLKHVARLRSWNEKLRTMLFCLVYYAAWWFNALAPTLMGFAVLLVLIPQTRGIAFPAVPIALVNYKTGNLQNPRAGIVGSEDSITGAAEVNRGEAVEGEASNFVARIAAMVLSSTLGEKPQNEITDEIPKSNKETEPGTISDPSTVAAITAEVKTNTTGEGSKAGLDAQTHYVEDAVWEKTRPMMHSTGDLCDVYERFGNALSPTPMYPVYAARFRIAMVLVTLVVPMRIINAHMVVKGLGFLIGLLFFGQPIITKAVVYLNQNFPAWPESLELRNTLLKGVPTNAQLTIQLLRMAEAKSTPLPPPPLNETTSILEEPISVNSSVAEALNTTPSQLSAAIQPDQGSALSSTLSPPVKQPIPVATSQPTYIRTSALFLLNTARWWTGAGVNLVLGADQLIAQAGAETSKSRVGVVESPALLKVLPKSGPVNFTCRYAGEEGMVSVHTNGSGEKKISFTYTGPTAAAEAAGRQKAREMLGLDTSEEKTEIKEERTLPGFSEHGEEGVEAWEVKIEEIKEIRKVGGLGWKGKLIVGWALGRIVENSLEIVDRDGVRYLITAVPLRDALFNRLISIGEQRWECR